MDTGSAVQPHSSLLAVMEQVKSTKCYTQKTVLLKSLTTTVCRTNHDLMRSSLQTKLLSPLFTDVTQLAIPAEFRDRGHFIYDKDDFVALTHRTETVLNFLHAVFDICCQCFPTSEEAKPLALDDCLPLLIVVLTANIRNSLWATDSVRKLTLLVLNQLRKLYRVDSLSDLLQLDVSSKVSSPKRSLLGQYLQVVQPRLQKENWQASPTFVESFFWMLTQMIKFPHLSEYLDWVLPPALMLMDSHVTEHKVMGIQCLQHIASNATHEELRWFGRLDVIYSILKQQVYSREPEVVRALHPALLAVLPIVDKNPANPSPPTLPKETDAILSILIRSAVTENGIVLRRLYTQMITGYVEALGVCVVRHLSLLLKLVCDYLEVFDGPEELTRLNTLRLLVSVLRVAWPRMHGHAGTVLKSLLKLVQDLSFDKTTTPDSVKLKVKEEAVVCLGLLKESCPDIEPCLQAVACSEQLTNVGCIVEKLCTTENT